VPVTFTIPLQITSQGGSVTVIAATGNGFTVNVALVVEVHPAVSPVRVKTVVAEGFADIVLEVAPVFQVYELAPVAVSVAVPPAHIESPLTVILGLVLTNTDVVAVAAHTPPLVPVTV
jgi:hypothetical protein